MRIFKINKTNYKNIIQKNNFSVVKFKIHFSTNLFQHISYSCISKSESELISKLSVETKKNDILITRLKRTPLFFLPLKTFFHLILQRVLLKTSQRPLFFEAPPSGIQCRTGSLRAKNSSTEDVSLK